MEGGKAPVAGSDAASSAVDTVTKHPAPSDAPAASAGSATNRPPSSTDVTALHIGATAVPAATGSHIGEIWGGVRLERLLGKGGMGAVYLGTQLDLHRPVAVKVLPSHLSEDPQFRERFELEAKAVARISSPHVVQVYFTGIHQGHHFFVMEFVDGEDLARRLKAGFKPSYRQALDLVTQAARGLAAAGEQGIIHRDIKPGNMMIDRRGLLKLMDFGLARLVSSGHNLTMTGTVMGTVSYFSPEQGRGEPCDQRTDIYALGVVFYELLTGRLPFTGESATSIIYQHIHVPPRAPRELDPQIPEHYQAVVLKCLQKRADDRYVDANELLRDLDSLAHDQPPAIALNRPELLQTGATIVAPSTHAGQPAPSTAARRPRVLASSVLIAALAIAGWWWLAQRTPAESKPAPLPAGPQPPPSAAPASPGEKGQEAAPVTATAAAPQDDAQGRREMLTTAEALIAAGRLSEAEQALAGLAQRFPSDREVAGLLVKLEAAKLQAQRDAMAKANREERLENELAQARAALSRGDFVEARRLVAAARAVKPADAAWAALATALDAAEGQQLIEEARQALARGQLEQALATSIRAQRLLPHDEACAALRAAIDEAIERRRQRDRVLADAEGLMVEQQPQKAEELLTALAAAWPDDAAVQQALRRARAARERLEAQQRAVAEQLELGEAALARNDLDAAQIAYTAARQIDPANQAAARGLEAVRQRREAIDALRRRVEAALAANDLDSADRAFAELQATAPQQTTTMLVAAQIKAAKLARAEAQARAEALERQRQEQARQWLARLDDLKVPLTELEQGIAAFIAEAGAERPEVPVLQQRLQSRRVRAAIEQAIGALEQAVARREIAAIQALFSNEADGAPFVEFAQMPQARLRARLLTYNWEGAEASTEIELVHAMEHAPEERLVVRWTWRPAGEVWRIAAAPLTALADKP
ncbi:MAG: protein kinase [Planctomycetota bacterium]|nr:protein kinase [Planctomycetota bacterium]